MREPISTLNCATEGIGRAYPQHQAMGPAYDYDAPNSVHQLSYDALPDFEPNFSTVIIHAQAKLTDILSSSPIRNTGYLVSARLRAVLSEFSLPLHRFYPVSMTHRNKPVAGYFWVQLPQPQLLLSEDASAASVEAAIGATQELVSLDLLRLYRPARVAYCFVSAPLRRAIELAGITGVRFGTAKLFRSATPQDAPGRTSHQSREP